jgi:hypothetical protein
VSGIIESFPTVRAVHAEVAGQEIPDKSVAIKEKPADAKAAKKVTHAKACEVYSGIYADTYSEGEIL